MTNGDFLILIKQVDDILDTIKVIRKKEGKNKIWITFLESINESFEYLGDTIKAVYRDSIPVTQVEE